MGALLGLLLNAKKSTKQRATSWEPSLDGSRHDRRSSTARRMSRTGITCAAVAKNLAGMGASIMPRIMPR